MYNDPELNSMSIVLEALQGLDRRAANRVLDWAASKYGVVFEELEEESSSEVAPLPQDGESPAAPVAPVAPVVPGAVQMVYVPTDQAAVMMPPQMANIAPVPPPQPQMAPTLPSTPVAPVVTDPVPSNVEPVTDEPTDTGSPQLQDGVQVDTGESDEANEEDELPVENNKQPATKGLGLKRYKNIENLFLSSNVPSVASRIVLAASFLQEKLQFEEISSYDINSRLKRMGYGVTNITNAINSLLNKKIPLMRQTKKEGETKQSKRKFLVTEEGLAWALTLLKSAEE